MLNQVGYNQSVQPKKVLFICRGSARDGLGHVTRTRTIAGEMNKIAAAKVVIIGDVYVENLLTNSNLDYVIVSAESEVLPIYEEFQPDVTVFDLLHFDKDYFWAISQSTPVVSLSPVFNRLMDSDIVFHRSAVLGEHWTVTGAKPVIRNGLQYSIINEHCYKIDEHTYIRNLEADTLSVAVSMGGTDAANKTLQVLGHLKQINEKLLLWVFLGEGYAHSYQDLVRSMHGSGHEVILVKTNESMWRVLSMCSVAILAGGTTTYEAVYAGLPSIVLLESKKNFFLIKELVDKSVCLYSEKLPEAPFGRLNEFIREFYYNRARLMEMHLNTKGLIDDYGARRITKEIYELKKLLGLEKKQNTRK